MHLEDEFRIVSLADAPDAIASLVRLFIEEWNPYYGSKGPGDAAQDLRECCNCDQLPIGLVALNASGTVLGTAALKSESVGAELGVGPWLAALLVPHEHQNKGVGTALVDAIENEARRLGFESIFTSTDAAASIIKRRGWTELEEQVLSLRGPVPVYKQHLGEDRPESQN